MRDPAQPSKTTRIHEYDEETSFEVQIDGRSVPAFPGESIAAVLLAAGSRIFTQPSSFNLARTLFCGMGLCHQCLVTVDGVRNVRACVTRVLPKMKIQTSIEELELDERD